MAEPITLPLIPWTGGLNRRQNKTMAHHSQLVLANDIVYDFDGTKQSRGGQSHRNKIPIVGGVLDDHFTQAPPGTWVYTVSDFILTHVNEESSYRGSATGSSGTTTIRRTYAPRFPDNDYSIRFRIKTNSIIGSSGTYFEVVVDGGAAGSGDAPKARIRFRGDGIGLAVNTSTTDLLSTTIGTFEEMDLSGSLGTDLYDATNYHTWRLDVTSDGRLKLFFDEQVIFTSNVTNIKAAGTGAVDLTWKGGGAGTTIDVEIDSIWVTHSGITESMVTALYDFPRPATKPFDRVDFMVAVVNGRVFVDPGDHSFSLLILDNYEENGSNDQTFFSFASFKGNLLIGRSGGRKILKWAPGTSRAVPLVGNPPEAAILRVHKSRVFATADPSNPSTLYFSAFLDDEDWTTEDQGTFLDSGFEPIDPEDGGFTTGIGPSFQGELIIYKNTGIYRLQGDDPENFVMSPITKKIGGIGHHAIQNILNDQYFLSPFGVHSLLTTERFGDLEYTFLSNDIRDFWNDQARRDQLARTWAFNNEHFDRYEILLSVEDDDTISSEHLNRILCLNYGATDELHPSGRWSVKLIRGGSGIIFQDEDSRNHAFVGGVDGFVNRQDERFTHDFPVYKVVGA